MARQHEKQAHDSAGNIPSLLLTNPVFCLFETAGQMVNTGEIKEEIHGEGSNDRCTDKKTKEREMLPSKYKNQKSGQGKERSRKETKDVKSKTDIKSHKDSTGQNNWQKKDGKKYTEHGQEMNASDMQNQSTACLDSTDSHSRRRRRSECPPYTPEHDDADSQNDRQPQKQDTRKERKVNDYSTARRTNEHEKTRSKGSKNVSFIETQKKNNKKKMRMKGLAMKD